MKAWRRYLAGRAWADRWFPFLSMPAVRLWRCGSCSWEYFEPLYSIRISGEILDHYLGPADAKK